MATILIVDDLSANRKFLATLLGRHGHRLVEAVNGREGLAAVKIERPDLVITDVLMPVMDGYEFVKRLRLDPATSAIPVLFYTAPYGEREAKAFARASGLPYVLTKPGHPEEVLKIVGRVLAGESEAATDPDAAGVMTDADHHHLRLLTDQLSEKTEDLKDANARLRALINIGLDLASSHGSDRLLESVCEAACDLFGATYVTLGIVDRDDTTLRRFATYGTESSDWINAGEVIAGVLETVITERRTVRGSNPGGEAANQQFPGGHPDVQAFLAAPIASRAHVYGWMCLVGNEGQIFSDADEPMVMALAGQVGRIYELEYEILERKHAESALRDERDRAQQYLDTAAVILLALDLDGRITLINRNGCDLLGWTELELLGRDWVEACLPARIRDDVTRRLHRLFTGGPSLVENLVVTKSGEERLIEWRNTVLRSSTGAIIGTLSSGADITERRRGEDALRLAEERMRFALQTTGVGIWDMDAATSVVRWSGILESQYGLQPGTFAGTLDAFFERIHPDDQASVRDTVTKAMTRGTDFAVQNRSIRADGTVRWLSGAGRFWLGEHGEPVRGVGISQDVTERRELEQQSLQGQKMEAIGRLAGGVAHDFNNLLTAILGYCELLQGDLKPGDLRRSDIAEIHKAGTSAAGLTRQLLAFSRKQIIEPTWIDLNVLVSGMQPLLARLIREDVKIALNLQPQPTSVRADHGQMEQIIMNLAVNARDAMPVGGTLTIETTSIELDEHYAKMHRFVIPGSYVVLSVSDTGTGMTPQVQARLFEPFFTTKELGKGTGLGLATVHGIVTQGGGSVSVYTEVGKGTTFNVYLPRVDAADGAVRVAPPAPQEYSGHETILVVEDAAGLRALTKRLLERHGYTVLVAANADEALEIFARNGSISLLLTDVVMPGASGPELTQQLVAQRPGLRVVFMSGYTEATIVHDGVMNPGIAFLHKPFTSDSLGRKVRETLDRVAAVV
jgi:two-component system cell cycle sensor histidine kinase/response regulator CckA